MPLQSEQWHDDVRGSEIALNADAEWQIGRAREAPGPAPRYA